MCCESNDNYFGDNQPIFRIWMVKLSTALFNGHKFLDAEQIYTYLGQRSCPELITYNNILTVRCSRY